MYMSDSFMKKYKSELENGTDFNGSASFIVNHILAVSRNTN